MSSLGSGKRLSIGLAALVLLAVIGWLVKGTAHASTFPPAEFPASAQVVVAHQVQSPADVLNLSNG